MSKLIYEPQFIGILSIKNVSLWNKIKNINVLYLKVFIDKEIYTIGNIELKKIEGKADDGLRYEITGDLLIENLKSVLKKETVYKVNHFDEIFSLGTIEFIEYS